MVIVFKESLAAIGWTPAGYKQASLCNQGRQDSYSNSSIFSSMLSGHSSITTGTHTALHPAPTPSQHNQRKTVTTGTHTA